MKKMDPNTNTTRHHKEMLGMDVPKNYFEASRARILDNTSLPKKENAGAFYFRPAFRYAIAAAVVLLIGLGITLKFMSDSNVNTATQDIETFEFMSMSDEDILISSILVDNEGLELFLDQYLLEGVMVKAELNEQEFDQIFMNSIFIKDSLIDNYIDDQFIDNIIL